MSTTEISTSVKLTTRGRASRLVFWKHIALSLWFTIGVPILISISENVSGEFSDPAVELAMIIIMISFLWATMISIFGYIRRLHDLDQSGFLVLLNMIPFVNFIMLIYCGCVEGTKGANKYGQCSNCQ